MEGLVTPKELKGHINRLETYTSCRRYYVVNGCFDLLHASHISFLEKAKKQCVKDSILIVGINSDKAIQTLKGDSRPLIPQDQRLYSIRSLKFVDYAFIFDSVDFSPYLEIVPKCTLIKGSDYTELTESEERALEKSGGDWWTVKSQFGVTTSSLVKKIKKTY